MWKPSYSPPPTVLVLLAVTSVQVGAGIAKQLFSSLGPGGTVFLRVFLSALVLLVAVRPRLGNRPGADYRLAALFGLSLGLMNFVFYSALDRIPLGVAVTLEFVGPLGVAIWGSRRVADVLIAAMAATGIVLLAPWGGLRLDLLGVLLALTAGMGWAAYIVLSARVGRRFSGGEGLALALAFAGVLLVPVGVISAGHNLLRPQLIATGAGVAMLSAAIPYSMELEALRHLPTRVFGVLMSLEPAIAALVGFVVLREALGMRAVVAILLVTLASIGASGLGAGEVAA